MTREDSLHCAIITNGTRADNKPLVPALPQRCSDIVVKLNNVNSVQGNFSLRNIKNKPNQLHPTLMPRTGPTEHYSLTEDVSMVYLPSNSPAYARVSKLSNCCICLPSRREGLCSHILATAGSAFRMRSHSGSVSASGRPRCRSASNENFVRSAAARSAKSQHAFREAETELECQCMRERRIRTDEVLIVRWVHVRSLPEELGCSSQHPLGLFAIPVVLCAQALLHEYGAQGAASGIHEQSSEQRALILFVCITAYSRMRIRDREDVKREPRALVHGTRVVTLLRNIPRRLIDHLVSHVYQLLYAVLGIVIIGLPQCLATTATPSACDHTLHGNPTVKYASILSRLIARTYVGWKLYPRSDVGTSRHVLAPHSSTSTVLL